MFFICFPPEIYPDSMICLQVGYPKVTPGSVQRGVGKVNREDSRGNEGCSNEQVTPCGKWTEFCMQIPEDCVEFTSGLYQLKKEVRKFLYKFPSIFLLALPFRNTCPSAFTKIFSNFSPTLNGLFFSQRQAVSIVLLKSFYC